MLTRGNARRGIVAQGSTPVWRASASIVGLLLQGIYVKGVTKPRRR